MSTPGAQPSGANRLGELLGESPAMVAVRDQVTRFLRHQSQSGGRRLLAVLIEGETGTGKGLLARAMHRASPRVAGPFIDINCAAIPETLLESELFGFERGAFTDARQPKPGLLQAGHGGTVFLDEVGLLPEPLQAKLLTAIEAQAVRRLGSTREERVDAWIVSATSENLTKLIREHRFRRDLYHRLAGLTVSLPPLRERGGDRVLLAERFLARACVDYGLGAKRFAADARIALTTYSWPGNVRELANVVERATMLSDGLLLSADSLALSEEPAAEAKAPEAVEARAVDDVVKAHVASVLRATNWNLSRAAALLGMSRNTLSARIERYGLRAETPAKNRGARAHRRSARPAAESSPPAESRQALPVQWERRRLAVMKVVLGDGEEASHAGGRTLRALADKLHSFGGDLQGSGPSILVAVFGLEPSEDAAVRAAVAAFAIRAALDRDGRRDGTSVAARIGIHVGYGLVSSGSGILDLDIEAKREMLTVLAALLHSVGPDTIAVSEASAPFLERRFALTLLGIDAGPAGRAYRLTARKPTGFESAGRVAPFVGRAGEIDVLRSRLALAVAGHGQVVGIVGEPGIGKSRLLYELRQALAGTAVTFLQGPCVSYGRGVPFLPIVEMLSEAWGLAEHDGPELTARKLRERLEALGLDPDQAAPCLLRFLGVAEGAEALEPLTAEAIHRRTLEVLRAIALRSSRHNPVVLALEDVHWIDTSSDAYLASLAGSLSGAPILVLLTYRPGYRSSVLDTSYATQIALSPLSDRESLTVMHSMVGTDDVPTDFANAILRKAEGNPFFIEELARALAGRAGAAELRVPDSIQTVLSARIDQLPGRARRLLHTAALLGRRSQARVLEAVGDGGEDHAALLQQLTQLEFLYEAAEGDEPTYVFKHSLTQEVAYETLPIADRPSLHLKAARALERFHADRLHEVYDRLAYHFSKTPETGTAIDYLIRLADKAAAAYANVETVTTLEEALTLADRLPAGDWRRRLDVVLRLAQALHFVGRMQERLELLLRHADVVAEVGDAVLSGRYHLLLGVTYSLLGDRAHAGRSGTRALEEATRGRDAATMGKAHYMLAHEAYWAGALAAGVEHGRRAVELLEGQGEPWWCGMAHWILGVVCGFMGDFDAAFEAERQAQAIGQHISDPRLVSYADWTMGGAYAVTGDHDAGITACRRGLEQSPDPVGRANALGFLGGSYLESGNADTAIPLLEESVGLFAQFRITELEGWFTTLLGEAHLLRGDIAKARELATRGLALGRSSAYWVAIAYGQRALGRIARARGVPLEAERHLLDACDTFRAHQALHELGRTLLSLAAVAGDRGDRASAASRLDEARRLFETLAIPAYVARANALAAELTAPREEDLPS